MDEELHDEIADLKDKISTLNCKIVLQFQDLLPKHKCSLSISHNEHRDYYESAAEYISRDPQSWKDEEAKQRAIATDEIWEIQWYPDTPIGFHRVCAPTLAEAMEMAQNAALNAR